MVSLTLNLNPSVAWVLTRALLVDAMRLRFWAPLELKHGPTRSYGRAAADFLSRLISHISCEFDKCHPEEQLIY